jgi:PTS system nitrogen regulatory IIA component
MELDIKAAAALLGVSEKNLYRWIRDQGLPAHCINEQYHFNRAELLEWATAQGVKVSPAMFAPAAAASASAEGLAAALLEGGIHHDVVAADKQAALAAAIGLMPVPADVDRDLLLDIILARESLGSTGLGDGIAIPHVRNPIVMHIPRPLVTLCFLATPVEFDAVDGQPVHTLFTIVCPAIKAHLHLLSRLAYALRHPDFAAVIRQRAPQAAILAAAAAVDHAAPAPARPAEGKAP